MLALVDRERQPELTIIAPMYNEEENVARTVTMIEETMSGFGEAWELVLVNDGSTDGTLDAALALADEKSWLRVVSYPVNRGRGKALRTGFAAAAGRFVVTTDFDLSYSPDHILRLYGELKNNPRADIVLGSAYMKGGTVRDVPLMRAAASRLGNIVLSAVMDGRVHTITCILRGYRREALDRLDLHEDGKELHLEILSKAFALGLGVVEIPADLRGRVKGKSKFRLKATSASHIAFSFLEKPTLLFGLIGTLMLAGGLATGLFIIFKRFAGTLNPTRPLMTLTVLLILAGIQVISIGFLSLQILNLRKEIYRLQSEVKRVAPAKDDVDK